MVFPSFVRTICIYPRVHTDSSRQSILSFAFLAPAILAAPQGDGFYGPDTAYARVPTYTASSSFSTASSASTGSSASTLLTVTSASYSASSGTYTATAATGTASGGSYGTIPASCSAAAAAQTKTCYDLVSVFPTEDKWLSWECLASMNRAAMVAGNDGNGDGPTEADLVVNAIQTTAQAAGFDP